MLHLFVQAKRVLKSLMIRKDKMDHKIIGITDLQCTKQKFVLKSKDDKVGKEITVIDYYRSRGIKLTYSAELPCIIVGKTKRQTYFPIEFCDLISLQRYKKSMTAQQRSNLLQQSRQKPQERMQSIHNAFTSINFNSSPTLRTCGIAINDRFAQVEGRVLQPPQLVLGNKDVFMPRNGRWNMNNKKFNRAVTLANWCVVNFSVRCQTDAIVEDLTRSGKMKGMTIQQPFDIFEEHHSLRNAAPQVRVGEMFNRINRKFRGVPTFILCMLEKKNSEIYAPLKRKCLVDFGIVTQCIVPNRINDQYLTNVLLKINAKLGGINTILELEESKSIPKISRIPTMILGMDVSHGLPGRSDQSIAAVVSSREWPYISKYKAMVRGQKPKLEMIDGLYEPVIKEGRVMSDSGIMREAIKEFCDTSKRFPEQIIIFRDGVSESQFNQVLDIELDKMIKACKFYDEARRPKFTVIIAQKRHNTRFFLTGGNQDSYNVPPGTVVEKTVCHPRNYDFYMCSHAGMIGTSRPTHYQVLLDENNFSPDELQDLVHSLSYVYQRSTTSVSIVAPVYYAHLAAAHVRNFMNFDEATEATTKEATTKAATTKAATTKAGKTTAATTAATDKEPDAAPSVVVPRLNERVANTMFFC